ncbi:MAG TPA: hypothetical protein VHN80_08685 [Kineosporiaceae bacterium]|nr:hypothetical protein [Kineosporiaceae bacterium]
MVHLSGNDLRKIAGLIRLRQTQRLQQMVYCAEARLQMREVAIL